jgi:hypothetical protein
LLRPSRTRKSPMTPAKLIPKTNPTSGLHASLQCGRMVPPTPERTKYTLSLWHLLAPAAAPSRHGGVGDVRLGAGVTPTSAAGKRHRAGGSRIRPHMALRSCPSRPGRA